MASKTAEDYQGVQRLSQIMRRAKPEWNEGTEEGEAEISQSEIQTMADIYGESGVAKGPAEGSGTAVSK